MKVEGACEETGKLMISSVFERKRVSGRRISFLASEK